MLTFTLVSDSTALPCTGLGSIDIHIHILMYCEVVSTLTTD